MNLFVLHQSWDPTEERPPWPTASPFLPAPKANRASHSNAKPSVRQGVWDQAENLRQSVAHSAPVSVLVLSWSTGLLPRTLQGALSPQTIGLVLLGKSTARHGSLCIRNSNQTTEQPLPFASFFFYVLRTWVLPMLSRV